MENRTNCKVLFIFKKISIWILYRKKQQYIQTMTQVLKLKLNIYIFLVCDLFHIIP